MKQFLYFVLCLYNLNFSYAQTFTKPSGSIIGGMTVMNLPATMPIYPNGQLLVYYPPDYYTKSVPHPLFIFCGGDGEENSLDITQLTNQSVPYLIANQGLRPYSIRASNDTIGWIVVSIHDNAGQVYTYPQLQYVIPWILDKAGLNIDSTCVWVGGLSGGGSATWSTCMGNKIGDTLLGKRLTGILPMANGGYDNWIGVTGNNLASLFKSGLSCLYIIGDQDAGYNQIGYFKYDSLARKNALSGHYITRVVIGGTHSSNVWNIPFPIQNQVWPNVNMNTWQLMWSLRKIITIPVLPPPVVTPPPPTTPYPVRIVMKMSDSSCNIIWQKQ